MGRSDDDEYGFSSNEIIAAAISAEELADVLHSPDVYDSEQSDCDVRLIVDEREKLRSIGFSIPAVGTF